MEIEIFKVNDGYGYRVGCVFQEFDPDCEGFVPMTLERAEELSIITLSRLT